MVSQPEAVIFDVDDTLFDRRRAQEVILQIIVQELPAVFNGLGFGEIHHAFAESDRIACEEYDAGILRERFRDRRSKLFLQILGLDQSPANTISDLYVTRYPAVNAPVPGALSTVKSLAHVFRLGVVSNGFPDVQYRKLEALQLRQCFACIVLSEEVGIHKPDPAIFQLAASMVNVRPEACLYVGDLFDVDVVGAKEAGMQACWFNPHSLARPAGDTAPDMEICQLSALATNLQITPCPTKASSRSAEADG